jgi:hypothetical protein
VTAGVSAAEGNQSVTEAANKGAERRKTVQGSSNAIASAF